MINKINKERRRSMNETNDCITASVLFSLAFSDIQRKMIVVKLNIVTIQIT
jgi:hypothetical protein